MTLKIEQKPDGNISTESKPMIFTTGAFIVPMKIIKRLFNFFRIKWIMAKEINRRGREGSQRVVVSLCAPLRSLRVFESSRKIIKSVIIKNGKKILRIVHAELIMEYPSDTR